MRKKIALFDLCGTLYKSNTTFDFIVFYHKRNKKVFKWLQCVLLTSYPGKVLQRVLQLDSRKILISTLSGTEKTLLDECAGAFVEEFLGKIKRQKAFEKLNSLRSSHDIIIVSASIDPVVNAVANCLNVRCVSSVLKYGRNGKCKGVLEKDVTGKKHEILRDVDFVATDNISDAILVKNSGSHLIFSKKTNYRKWKSKLNIEEGELNIVFI